MSGAWLSAKSVMDACNATMDSIMSDWKVDFERNVQLIMDRGEWSWLKWRQVPLTRKIAELRVSYINPCRYFIESPMRHPMYEQVQALLTLASHVEELQSGSQIFVSKEDSWIVRGAR
jgi:hypothetical protein